MKAFLSNAALRPSCFQCMAKRFCGSDITLGDFWGIQSVHPNIDCEEGVSAVLINTMKGDDALGAISSRLQYGESSFDNIANGNPALVRSVKPYYKYDPFMQDLSHASSIGLMMDKWNFKLNLYQRVRKSFSKIKQRIKRLAVEKVNTDEK